MGLHGLEQGYLYLTFTFFLYFIAVILPVVLFWCGTWSLTLREGYRLKVLGIRVLRRIFGPEMDEVTGDRRKLHNEKPHNLYSSLSIMRMIKSRRTRWAAHVVRMGRRVRHIGYWWESQKNSDHCEHEDVGGWTILKWTLEI
jgi:hypothetical protein